MHPRSGRAHALLVLLLCAFACAATTTSARADALPIDFQGEVDSAGPLVIDPSAAGDPVTTTLQPASVPVYLIERMPQTKSVTTITLGDYGQGSCSGAYPRRRARSRSVGLCRARVRPTGRRS